MKLSFAKSYGDEAALEPSPAALAAFPNVVSAPLFELPRARYGEKRAPNLAAIIVTATLHAAALAAILYVRYEAPPAEKESQLTVVDLTPPPPAPAPETPRSPPQVVAPAPPIAVPRPIIIATTPDPVPQPETKVVPPAPPPAPPIIAAVPSVVNRADLSARMISGAPPRYPIECRRKREQGTVVLALTLDVDGRVASISVARSSGHDRLDDAALSAVRKWRWQPLVKDGKPMMVKGEVEIPFVLTA